MNGILNENQLTIVKDYEFDKPLNHKIDSIIDNCNRDCQNKDFHTFEYKCLYNNNFKNNRKNETVSLLIGDKSMGLYEIIEKLKNGRQRGFIFNQINKLTIKFYSHQRYITISYHLKL